MDAMNVLHQQLAPEVRDVAWSSNCAGEVFAQGGSADGLRIGHFQGEAELAAFVVAAHDACRAQEMGK
ncbi:MULTISPECIES: hypothetical protein [Acidovorax]|uniref:Uncharacterized protein n=1 Tax=Acidovorax facilis TaxID=12917 RepID=A0ABV8DHU2_9BURK|nr:MULTISPECIES: hypothetical protein [Acidovorax]KQB56127.1 hypothetical protein AE621_27855 [Acidovorax sp. SD340]MBO1011469.1 hypothetical protein [Acidovorax sp. SD340]MCO4245316.1 hypothetical protein [Acidovorax facilis]